MATKKSTKKSKNKVDFSDSIKSFRTTAKKMNDQVQDMADEVVGDIKESSEHLKDYVVESVKASYKKTYSKISDAITVENLRKTTKKINNYSIKTADELVDGMIENGEKWQKLTEKAVKGGLKLASKQQEMAFDTLETIKGQLSKSAMRFLKLVSKN